MIKVSYMYYDNVVMTSVGNSAVIPHKGDLVQLPNGVIYTVKNKLIMFDSSNDTKVCAYLE